MTVVSNAILETVYSKAKTHEASLAKVVNSGHRVERDVFGQLLGDVREMAQTLEGVLEERRVNPDAVEGNPAPDTITPRTLIDQRNDLKSDLREAISQFTTESSVRARLEQQYAELAGGGQGKLEILSAAVVSDQ